MSARTFALQLLTSVVAAVVVAVVIESVRERRANAKLPEGPAPGYGQV